jgi:hypothetical protein
MGEIFADVNMRAVLVRALGAMLSMRIEFP